MSLENRFFSPENLGNSEGRKKEKMSDRAFGDLLSAVGNHEIKAVLLSAMQSRPYTSDDLEERMRELEGRGKATKRMPGSLFQFCRQSLHPIGLVAEEITMGGQVVMYEKTEKGRKFGDALAGHLLDFSEKNNISLIQLFGVTHGATKITQESNEDQNDADSVKRAPYARRQIFREILKHKLPMTETMLLGKMDIKEGSLMKHLRALNDAGLIHYTSVEGSKQLKVYTLLPNKPESWSSRDRIKEIYQIYSSSAGLQL